MPPSLATDSSRLHAFRCIILDVQGIGEALGTGEVARGGVGQRRSGAGIVAYFSRVDMGHDPGIPTYQQHD